MKVLVGTDIAGSGYAFDASAKTITLTGLNPVAIEDVLLITNVVDNVVIYQFNDPAKGGTCAANVITLTHDVTAMADADELQIWIQYKASLDIKDINTAGAWGYNSGVSGTLTLTGGKKVLQITAIAEELAATITINGGDVITLPYGSTDKVSSSITIEPKGNLVNPVIVFTNTKAFFVEYTT